MSRYGAKKELKNIYFKKGAGGSSIHMLHLLLEECRSDCSEVTREQCMDCWGTGQLPYMSSQPECVLSKY